MISRRTLVISGLSVAALGAAGYAAWPRLGSYNEAVERQRRLLESDPSLAEFVRMATLAANGHNTQPWKFRLEENSVAILPDLTRRTEVVDPDDHHLYVSLGCAAENLAIAAGAHGRPAEVDVLPGTETSIRIALGQGTATGDALYRTIPQRQSTRSEYDGRKVPEDEMRLLEQAAKEYGVSVRFFNDETDMEAILEFVIEANKQQMDDPAFMAELREWLRFSPSESLRAGDGLFSACSGNPAMPEWLGSRAFNAFFTKDAETEKYSNQIRSSAGIAVFTADRADPENWIRLGRSFERFSLQATALGIRNAHVNQPVEVADIRPEFAAWLGTPEARPDLVIRFGYAPALPMSVRRPVEQVLLEA